MKYCVKCGSEIADDAMFCPSCGQGVAAEVVRPIVPDEPSSGINVLSFFFPVVGLILYLVWKDATPLKAKAAGKWGLIGFIAGIVGYFVVYGCTMASLTSSLY